MLAEGHPGRADGSGLSRDLYERAMERRLDDLMRRRLRHDTVDLASVVDQARKLHHYRAERGYPAHLDERVGKLDDSERLVARLLVAEGRNVSHVPPAKTGQVTPDLIVDGEIAEVKSSLGAGVQGFRTRLRQAQATRVFVNATQSRISPDAMSDLVQSLIDLGVLTYALVIGDHYDWQRGRW